MDTDSPPTPQTAGDLASEWQAIAEQAIALKAEVEAHLKEVQEALRQEKGLHEALKEKVRKLHPRMFDPKAPRY